MGMNLGLAEFVNSCAAKLHFCADIS